MHTCDSLTFKKRKRNNRSHQNWSSQDGAVGRRMHARDEIFEEAQCQ